MIFPKRSLLAVNEVDQKFENLAIKLFGSLEYLNVLQEYQIKLFACELFQNDRLWKGINKKLFCVGLQGQIFSESTHFFEEKYAVLVVLFTAISQNFKTQIHYFSDFKRVYVNSFFLARKFSRKPFDYF